MTICNNCNFDLGNKTSKFCPNCGGMLEFKADNNDPFIGKIIADRYRVISIIGEGGMGKLYLAEQRMGDTTRKVALKTLLIDLARDPEIVKRFLREAGTVVQLTHPNTIMFYDFGEIEENGSLYIVMEFIDGITLSKLITAEGPLQPKRVENFVTQICGSLHEAHEHGIVHRDLKPDNIILTMRGGQKDFVKVLDFGIAKRTNYENQEQKLTQQGTVLGTPPYMSPEQFMGQNIDRRSDIYSLAVMCYEMITKRLPFSGKTPWEWATHHLTSNPKLIDPVINGIQIPECQRLTIINSLSKKPEQRPQTALEFMESFAGKTGISVSASINSGNYVQPQIQPLQVNNAQPISQQLSNSSVQQQPSNLSANIQAQQQSQFPVSQQFNNQSQALYSTPPKSFNTLSSSSVMVANGNIQTKKISSGKFLVIIFILLIVMGGVSFGSYKLYTFLNTSKNNVANNINKSLNNDNNKNIIADNKNIIADNKVIDQNNINNINKISVQNNTDQNSNINNTDKINEVDNNSINKTEINNQVNKIPETNDVKIVKNLDSNEISAAELNKAKMYLNNAKSNTDSKNIDIACSNYKMAEKILGRSHPLISKTRNYIEKRGADYIGLLLLSRRCAEAQNMYRSLSQIRANGRSKQQFSGSCQTPK